MDGNDKNSINKTNHLLTAKEKINLCNAELAEGTKS